MAHPLVRLCGGIVGHRTKEDNTSYLVRSVVHVLLGHSMRSLGKGETSEPMISCTKTRKSSERGRDGEGKEEKRKRKEKKVQT